MVAEVKYIQGCHMLAEMTMQLNQNYWKPSKNVTFTGNSIVLAYPWGVRKGAILVRISVFKGKGKGGASPYKTLTPQPPPCPPASIKGDKVSSLQSDPYKG